VDFVIEWIVLGALALAGSRLGSEDKRSSFTGRAAGNFDVREWQRKRAVDDAAWRANWEGEVDRARWIPQSAAHRILEAYPPPLSAFTSQFGSASAKSLKLRELLSEFATHNHAHLAAQKAKLKAFFDTVEASPLTEEQVEACICMDDAVQVVAAAGSGKTSTMVAKTGYVLHEQLAHPEQILLLAFNTKAAAELKERVRKRLADVDGIDRVTVMTFHSFGRAVLAEVNRVKPAVAKWVGSIAKETEMIAAIVDDLRARNPKFGTDWDIFRTIYGRPVGRAEELTKRSDKSRGEIRTAGGEWVKSQEERLIADWLFYHGVRYEYERDYEHDTRSEAHQQYRPDFFYPDAGLYHEHFALDGEGRPPPHFEGDYVAGVAWKRTCHAEHRTELFETTSHSLRNGCGFDELAAALTAKGVQPLFDPSIPAKGQPPLATLELAGLVRAFQQHAKGGKLSVKNLMQELRDSDSRDLQVARSLRFLSLYERIAEEWERRLDHAGSVDFDDMLNGASEHIEKGEYPSPYTMVFADEFQDSSRARVRLLKALLDQTQRRGHLCVVGDDWQSINRFAGADLSVMTEFSQTFPHSSQLKLATTFRCPASLCDAAGAFVTANPRQLEKSVRTTNERQGPAMAAFAFESTEDATSRVYKDLGRLHKQAASGSLGAREHGRISVLLLGRYNHDRPGNLGDWQDLFQDQFDLQFRTIHSAKGLEADYVMILNMVEDTYGFPSQIADDPVLLLAMPEGETYPMAEERRIFYVALTRAKRQARIYTRKSSPSRFLVEMAKKGILDVRIDGGGKLAPCPECQRGVLSERFGPYGAFEACGSCDFKRNVPSDRPFRPSKRVRLKTAMAPGEGCPTCGTGHMKERAKARYSPIVGCSGFPSCQTTAPLLGQGTL
jgi:DNA helicase-4